MKFFKRILLVISVLILLLAVAGVTPLSNLNSDEKIERNFLNGLPGVNEQILVVKIDDTRAAHPQIGLEYADVVYVEQVEGGLTRLAAVYSSQLPPLIGPVRSARISDIELLAQYGRVGFAYSGAQKKMRPIIAAANLENLSAERNPPSIYGKDPERPGPVNMVLKPDLLLERANANPKINIEKANSYLFDFGDAPENGVLTSTAQAKWPSAKYELRWNEIDKKWLIYFDDQPNLAASGEHLFADTAIIQEVSITPSIYGDKFGEITPFSKTTGTGNAVMLRDGFSYNLNWERNTEADKTIWRTLDGEIASFKPGRIWIFLTDKPVVLAP